MTEELLHMVRDTATEPSAHVLPNFRRQVELVLPGQRCKTFGRLRSLPRPEMVWLVCIGVRAEVRLAQDRFQAHAAGEDQTNLPLIGLGVFSEPTQELTGFRLPLWSNFIVFPLHQSVDEDRQFVNCKHHGQVILSKDLKDLITPMAPVAVIKSGSQLDSQVVNSKFLNSVKGCAKKL